MNETHEQFQQAEEGYKENISGLESSLSKANQEIASLTELSNLKTADLKTLTEENTRLIAEKKRRNWAIGIMVLLLVVASGGVAASFLGFDLKTELLKFLPM